jgi:hypothetical protein
MKLLAIIVILVNLISAHRRDRFEEWSQNPEVQEIVKKYLNREINTIQALVEQHNKVGFKIAERQLQRYIKKLKVKAYIRIYQFKFILFRNLTQLKKWYLLSENVLQNITMSKSLSLGTNQIIENLFKIMKLKVLNIFLV